MAYRLTRGESVPEGVKRIAAEELDSALQTLRNASGDEGVHEVRKCLKKVRGLLRLVRPAMGDMYRPENERLRDIGLKLSPVRDAAALIEAVDELKDRRPAVSAIRRPLAEHKRHVQQELGIAELLPKIAGQVAQAKKRVDLWPLEGDGFPVIEPGLRRAFRDGRRALAAYRASAQREDMHEWRKRVKDHWYHVRLLEDLWTDVMKGYETALKELEDSLGESLNLSMLRERIRTAPESLGKTRAVEAAVKAIDEEEKALRDSALAIGDRVYGEKPRQMVNRIHRLWDAW